MVFLLTLATTLSSWSNWVSGITSTGPLRQQSTKGDPNNRYVQLSILCQFSSKCVFVWLYARCPSSTSLHWRMMLQFVWMLHCWLLLWYVICHASRVGLIMRQVEPRSHIRTFFYLPFTGKTETFQLQRSTKTDLLHVFGFAPSVFQWKLGWPEKTLQFLHLKYIQLIRLINNAAFI